MDEKDPVIGEEENLVNVEMDTLKVSGGLFFADDDEDEEKESKPKNSVKKKATKISTPVESKGLVVLDDDEDDTGVVLSSAEKMRYLSDQIVSCMVGSKEINKYAIAKLITSANPRLFRDENYVIFRVLYNYRDRIKRINIDSEFLKLYLYRNRKLLEESKPYIDIHAYGEVDGREDLGYIGGVLKHFNRLCGMPDLSVDEFELVFEKYLIEFKAVEASKAYATANMILTEGVMNGRKKLIGFDDSQVFLKKRLAEIEGVVDMKAGSGFYTMEEEQLQNRDEVKKPIKVADFDHLDKLNEYYGGIYTGNFYQVLAPPKSGKSKFCCRVCHTAVVKYGTNVSVWAVEGGTAAWSAQMRAIHFDYTYNQGVDVRQRKFGVSQDTILKDSLSDEYKSLEQSSKMDLLSNPEYGTVAYIDRPFEVETFLDDIDTSIKSNNSKILIIDYLQLMGSRDGKKAERERISEAYTRLLTYCKTNNVAVLTPGQYKQETFNNLLNMSDTSSADMRTSGGGSSEVLRTPDIIFAFWASTQDLQNNSLKILSMPCRFNRAFPEIPCYVDLETCDFISLDDKNG